MNETETDKPGEPEAGAAAPTPQPEPAAAPEQGAAGTQADGAQDGGERPIGVGGAAPTQAEGTGEPAQDVADGNEAA